MQSDSLRTTPVAILRAPVVWFMALAAAIGTATIYPLQPAIGEVAGGLRVSVAEIGLALAFGPVGYMLGLALLVPLVDRFPPRRVLSIQFGALATALAVTSSVGTTWLLCLVTCAVGAGSSVGAQLSSVGGRFADPARRATVLGIVTSGISAGILAGRIVGGWLTDVIAWRGMLLVFAVACAAMAVAARFLLPGAAGAVTSGYLTTLRALPGLYARFRPLRLAVGRGTSWFFAFCAVWAGLAVALSQPPYSYSSERIGLYAVAGLLGIAATRVAGAWTDRVGARTVILVGLGIAVTAAAALALCLSNTPATLVCLGLFDAGLFAAQVANQSTVLAIDPEAPAQFNSAYMLVYFIGGSIGTAFGAAAVGWFGWPATAAICAAAIAFAAAITAVAGGEETASVRRTGSRSDRRTSR
ncbi:MFS transporter [Mycobacterium sp. URHB0044]|uniref:MFS transporter n=1 Tax=Mycobacterium sp. URHB0044 TaxID=1380386 RepID=UPI0009E0669E|nr:MFS transporter [Mycobacterium sp. URHB0044]